MRSYRWRRRAGANITKTTCSFLNNRIIVLDGTGRSEQAEKALRDLIELERQFTADADDAETLSFLGVSLTSLSSFCRAKGKLTEAEALAREAIDLFENLARQSPKQGAVQYYLARARTNLGIILAQTERTKDAERVFRDALIRQEKLARFPNPTEVRQDLGNTHTKLAELLLQTKRLPEAEAEQLKALQVLGQLSSECPGRIEFHSKLAAAHHNLALVLVARGRIAEAEAPYQTAIDMFKKLHAGFPKEYGIHFSLGRAHFGLGSLLRRLNRPKGAEAADQEAVRLLTALTAEHPGMVDYHQYLARSLGNLAGWRRQHGEWSEARRLLNDALPHLQAAIEARPRAPEPRQFLCNNRTGLALTWLDQKQHAELAEAVEQLVRAARAASEETTAVFPSELMWGSSFLARCATLVEQDSQLPHTKRAELAHSYSDRAIATLRLAMKHGFNNAAKVRNEPFYKSASARTDFQELLAELEKSPK